jgi:hypothetical protein
MPCRNIGGRLGFAVRCGRNVDDGSPRIRSTREQAANTAHQPFAGVDVFAICKHCQHDARLDLPALIAAGLANAPLLELPLRCSKCDEQGHSIIAGRGVSST